MKRHKWIPAFFRGDEPADPNELKIRSKADINKPFLFVSYAHADEKKVLPIVEVLEENGYNVWYDGLKNLPPGCDWNPRIHEMLEKCTLLLAFYSGNYKKSLNCNAELQSAHGRRKRIQMVRLDSVKFSRELRGLGLEKTQYLEEYRYTEEQELYEDLFGMKGMEECRIRETLPRIPKNSFLKRKKRALRLWWIRSRRKRIRVAAILMILAGLGIAGWIKGPELMAQGEEFLHDALNGSKDGKGARLETVFSPDIWNEITGSEAGARSYGDSVTGNGEGNSFTFTADRGGNYCLCPNGMRGNERLRIRVTNSAGDGIADDWFMENGSALLLKDLKAGETCRVEVSMPEEGDRKCTYELTLWSPGNEVTLADNTRVTDSLEYPGQVKEYRFTSEREGRYTVSFSENTGSVRYRILDEPGTEIFAASFCENGYAEAPDVKFEAGRTYRILVEAQDEPTAYCMAFAMPSEAEEITEYDAVTDTLSYRKERNCYRFRADSSGEYRLDLGKMMEDTEIGLLVQDTYGKIVTEEVLRSETGCTVTLDEGTEYLLYLEQREGLDTYTLTIHRPSSVKAVRIGSKTKGEMEYMEQRNFYSFHAKGGTAYHVYVLDMSDAQSIRLSARNENDQQLDETGYAAEGLWFTPEKSGTVTVTVQQKQGLGDYRIVIEKQKEE